MDNPANSMRFNVTIDGIDVGSFTGLEGLSAEYEVTTYQEGGENSFVHQLPGRLKYSNIKLTRPVDLTSKGLAGWFRELARGNGSHRHSATVQAFNNNGETMGEWNFEGIWPVRYTGPNLAAESGKVATETFEFAHNGLQG